MYLMKSSPSKIINNLKLKISQDLPKPMHQIKISKIINSYSKNIKYSKNMAI